MIRKFFSLTSLVAVAVLLLAGPLYAAEGTGITREQWDFAMKIINFGILIFLVVRYGKAPMVNFLRGVGEQVKTKLGALETEEVTLQAQEAEQERMLATIDDQIEQIRGTFHQIGLEYKQRIIDQAERMSHHILVDAEAAAEHEYRKAAQQFRAEVVEMAVELAEERIRKKLTSKDHQTLVDGYLEGLIAQAGDAA